MHGLLGVSLESRDLLRDKYSFSKSVSLTVSIWEVLIIVSSKGKGGDGKAYLTVLVQLLKAILLTF